MQVIGRASRSLGRRSAEGRRLDRRSAESRSAESHSAEGRRARRSTLAALAVSALFALMLRVHPLGIRLTKDTDDLGQMVCAFLAAAACLRRARRTHRLSVGDARPWYLLAAGTAAWGCGEAVWSYYEVLARRETPFPSFADLGYLLFPAAAAVGLLVWPSAALVGGRRWRVLLDGVLVAASLFVISWVTALGYAVRTDGSVADVAVSIAYPVSDLVLLTLTVVLLAHSRHAVRSGLAVLGIGLASLAVADSGFAYLTAVGRYATDSQIDVGWVAGFLLIAAAASADAAPEPPAGPGAQQSALVALLPFAAAGLGLVVAIAGELAGAHQRPTLVAALLVMIALLCRQMLAILDNRRLVEELVGTQLELHHRAFHDALTGLANRALLHDRLRHSTLLHRRDRRPLSLLYVDLDGFKSINDTYGHDAGDLALRAAAERLRAVTRPGDTVARMGGDEFAVLLEDGGDPREVAVRILDAFAQPASLGHHTVRLCASIGIAELPAGAEPVEPSQLLQHADAAMYRAKRTGKGTAVVWTEASGSHAHAHVRITGASPKRARPFVPEQSVAGDGTPAAPMASSVRTGA